ncbi:MAG: type II toxin-antitoxin system Phd/YefM family antitoxin [Polyangiaceae bacterium]
MTIPYMQIPAAKFKATCLELMERVAVTGETYVITKHGRPVARLIAFSGKDEEKPRTGYGCMKSTILDSSPIDALFSTGERWEADRPRAR